MDDITLRDAIEQFVEHKRANDKRESTIRHYHNRITFVLRPLLDLKLSAIATDQIRTALEAADAGRSRATQSASRRSLANFQKWLVIREYIPKPWLRQDETASKGCDRRERFATDEETEQLLARAKRDFVVIYSALRATGARPNELARAQIEEVITEGDRRTLVMAFHKTSSKTGRPRMIPLTPASAPWFDEAMGERTTGHVFLRNSGKPWSVPTLSDRFRRLRTSSGIDSAIELYCARHEFITNVAREKGVTAAAALAGHAGTAMVEKHYLLWRTDDMHSFAS